MNGVRITVDTGATPRSVSPTLYGLFYEDLNRAGDGGLNANLVANHTFDGVYLDRRWHNETIAMIARRRGRVARDPLRHWRALGGDLRSRGGVGAPSPSWAELSAVDGRAVLRNSGYQPAGRRGIPAIAAREGVQLRLRLDVRSPAFAGTASARLVADDGVIAGQTRLDLPRGDEWCSASADIEVVRPGRVHLELVLDGQGSVEFDEVSLVPADHWGAGDPRWSQGVLRRDLVDALAALRPRFLRFPGGCVVEGIGGTNAYDWKRTVGPLAQRTPDFNLWGLRVPHGDYGQSNQVGFYEFFLLCEDLGIEPVPVVPAGISCQFRSRERITGSAPAFDALVQDVLDLIDWATGDPAESGWAALRAEAGHPEPFALSYLGIGNENHGADYLANFDRLRAAVREKDPRIIPILSAGPFSGGGAFADGWNHARRGGGPLLVDEHFYKSPRWFLENTDRYDGYPRGTVQVFAGEYAARAVTSKDEPNTWESALAEAAFLTGVERNADVVAMTSYAPSLNNVGSRLWPHNLIDFSPDAVSPTVNYEVQRLFGTTVGDWIVPVGGALPDGVFASSTSTSGCVNVKLVNTTGSFVEVRLEPVGLAGGRVVVTELTAPLETVNALEWSGPTTAHLVPRVVDTRWTPPAFEHVLPPHSVTSVDLNP